MLLYRLLLLSKQRVCVQTRAQRAEDFSEELADSHRRVDAAQQDLIKKATNVLEAKANLRTQQEAIKLLQVGLSHTHTTATCWRQALQVVMAVHLSGLRQHPT